MASDSALTYARIINMHMPTRTSTSYHGPWERSAKAGGRDIGRHNLKILSKLLDFIAFFFSTFGQNFRATTPWNPSINTLCR